MIHPADLISQLLPVDTSGESVEYEVHDTIPCPPPSHPDMVFDLVDDAFDEDDVVGF